MAVEANRAAESVEASPRCANCDGVLTGPYCARCGQKAIDLRRPFRYLLSELLDDAFSVDSRLARTIRPLLLRPGAVTKAHLAGRRATYLPPLRSYLIAALIFFGLFSIFPNRAQVEVFTTGESRSASGGGSRMSFEFPAHVPVNDEWYQQMVARARANPEAFARAVGAMVPRAFFLFLPIFALLLGLFYRRNGYYLDHLVFSLYYHAFAFLVLSVLFLVSRTGGWLPGGIRAAIGAGLFVWLLGHLPIALRRVYGGTRPKTALKLTGLLVLYLAVFIFIGLPLVTFAGLLTF